MDVSGCSELKGLDTDKKLNVDQDLQWSGIRLAGSHGLECLLGKRRGFYSGFFYNYSTPFAKTIIK